ncbi:MAG: hypothetical protein L0Y74_08205, partial [candidate division Zixibacteria bacterium]|nr:hypothetical protein [candidate division Zixibacteria bacterium]
MNFLRRMGRNILVLAMLLLPFSSSWGQEEGCSTPNGSSTPVPTPDTLKAVAIYACTTFTFPSLRKLPTWAHSIWDSGVQLSVPRFFKDNSLGKYMISARAFGRTSDTCWTATGHVPNPFAGGGPEVDPEGVPFFKNIMAQADDSINFSDFDSDQDDTVDACFFIVVNHGGNPGANTGAFLGFSPEWEYRSKDTNSTGDTVIVAPNRAVLVRSNDQNLAVSISVHEWGHALGAGHYYGSQGTPDWGLGAFTAMGLPQGYPGDNRPVPFDPIHRVNFKWVVPETVKTPLYQQVISDYLTTGKVYLLRYTTDQYFYVTNYRGVDPLLNPNSYWQENYAGFGPLIWHVGGPKGIDVELAHGLWNMSPSDSCKSGPGRTP